MSLKLRSETRFYRDDPKVAFLTNGTIISPCIIVAFATNSSSCSPFSRISSATLTFMSNFDLDV